MDPRLFRGHPPRQSEPYGAVGVKEAFPDSTVINLAGCPVNAENITATIVYYLTFGSLPAVDAFNRPLFAFGKRIYYNCERRAHFDAGQYVRQWGDDGHRRGCVGDDGGVRGPGVPELPHGEVQ